MPLVETLDNFPHRVRRIPIHAIKGNSNFENLFAVAHFHAAFSADWSIERTAQTCRAFRFHLREDLLDGGAIHGAGVADMGAGNLEPQIRRQHPPGGQHGGDAGDDNAG